MALGSDEALLNAGVVHAALGAGLGAGIALIAAGGEDGSGEGQGSEDDEELHFDGVGGWLVGCVVGGVEVEVVE